MIDFGKITTTLLPGADEIILEQVEDWMEDTLAPTAEQSAKRHAPVETGELRDKTFAVVEDGVLYLGSTAAPFPFVENGTKHMRPQPMARPAAVEALQRHAAYGRT